MDEDQPIDGAATEIKNLREQVAKLQAFKDYVHARLDAAGVPHHPPGPHGAEGCRVGDRLDWVFARVAELEAAAAAWVKAAGDAHEHWDADRDSKVGKLLAAMDGSLKGYRRELDDAHAALGGKPG